MYKKAQQKRLKKRQEPVGPSHTEEIQLRTISAKEERGLKKNDLLVSNREIHVSCRGKNSQRKEGGTRRNKLIHGIQIFRGSGTKGEGRHGSVLNRWIVRAGSGQRFL